MTKGSRAVRRGQKGVGAIFTSDKERRQGSFLIGFVAIIVGILLWATVLLGSEYPSLFVPYTMSSYTSLALSSLGEIVLINGVGICLAYSSPISARNRSKYPVDEVLSASRNLRYGFVAFLQGCLAISLYSGIVDEYQSNPSMEQWIGSVFPFVEVLVRREAVIVAAALMGLISVQFLPGRALSGQ